MSELVFEFPQNYANGVVIIRLKTENNSNISYSTRGNGYTSDIMPEYNGQYLFEQYSNKGWSQVYNTQNTLLLYVKSRKTFTVKESVSKAIKQEKTSTMFLLPQVAMMLPVMARKKTICNDI